MSIRKVSDLPGLNIDSTVDFDIERFKQSLLEISYVDPKLEDEEDSHTYKSMYMKGKDLTDAILSAGHVEDLMRVTLRIWEPESD